MTDDIEPSPSPARLRIALSDDHPVVRAGVRALLESAAAPDEAWSVDGEASGADELLGLLAATPLDLLITDFSMPGSRAGDGLTLLGQIRRRHPQLPVIVLTMIGNAPVLRSIAEAGVAGLLDKAAAAAELGEAVRTVAQGGRYIGLGLRGLVDTCTGAVRAGGALSPREAEVLRLFAAGHSVSQIAAHLHRSKQTISRQKTDAMAKLGLRSDREIYEYARTEGLLS
ncbi:response regulator transcription factor [Lysobacter enzymogenes]|uniref:Two-component system, NarL family, captular synthesis response regulator RcsB n=1 Tax=Lysobacter enzymogenes TaxID=69 RepID=A0AAU9AIC4_LYSEN|nr:response regulator transcription factor [Lysobacter enzymogenes]BAV97892.1 two-component system, NarL family, captular synthesis response regulator RcsB [Lysobacter enzymogenes]